MAIDWEKVATPGTRLRRARLAALASGTGIDALGLNPLKAGVPTVDIASRIVTARVLLTMDGASTVTLGIHDPDWGIEESGLLDTDADGRMNALSITLDTLTYRLAKASRQDPDTLTLTFEDLAWALLKEHDESLSASRGSVTRAQFIERMVREIRTVYIPFYSPEKGRRMPTERPDYPVAAPAHGTTGFDQDVTIKVEGKALDVGQMRNAATALTVADQEGSTDRATLALLEACIVEPAGFQGSGPFDNPTGGDSSSVGILQLLNLHLGGSASEHGGRRDVELVCRLFLTKGFTGAGGAKALALAHRDWSPGQIAQAVQGSRFPDRYEQVRKDADAVLAAWNPGDQASASGHEVLRVRSFQFTRGQPGKKENTVEAAQRLADDVNWRFYAAGGVASFNRDDFLMTVPAAMAINGPFDDRLIGRPRYDIDHGKLAHTIDLTMRLARWELFPAAVVVLTQRAFGPARGRWLALDLDFNLFDPNDTLVTLTKPLGAKKEPAPELVASAPSTAAPTKGAQTAIAWAKSKVGHFKESLGFNRGPELDKLEKDFGFQSAPWCAMFATTAVAQAVGDQCKTASVPLIRTWCGEGSHGYEKGFRATPKPGDLACYGGAHVALIVKVRQDGSYDTIEGNTGAGKVSTGSHVAGDGDFVRPGYVT